MDTNKTTRSNPSVKPERRRSNFEPSDTQLNAHIFKTLRHLNRSYGVALTAYDRLQKQDRWQRPVSFPQNFLANYRNLTEALRAEANRDLLRLIAGREEREAERFARLLRQPAERRQKSGHNQRSSS